MTDQSLVPDPVHTPEQTGPASMPGALIGALVLIGLQVLAGGYLGTFLLVLAPEAGPELTGLLHFAAWTSLLVAAIGVVCIAYSVRRRGWALTATRTFEVLMVVGGLTNVVLGQVSAIAGIALAAAILALVWRDDVRSWYRR